MAKLAIKGHAKRGKEVIELLEMLGGNNIRNLLGTDESSVYNIIDGLISTFFEEGGGAFTLEEFLDKYPYKIGDKVICNISIPRNITGMKWDGKQVLYSCDKEHLSWYCAEEIEPYKETEELTEDKGDISDGYHTFNELYEYRLLYNASMFNELAKQNLYDVHKSKRHSDGNVPFGNENWFIVQAELPTGQISNHYEMKDWDLFQVPVKEKANPYDGHTPPDVAKRLREFLTPKPKYPKTYEECCELLGKTKAYQSVSGYKTELLESFQKFLICRDAYWKIAGDWKPEFRFGKKKYCIMTKDNKVISATVEETNRILVFPTEEMRDAFYDNFKELIEECKELL